MATCGFISHDCTKKQMRKISQTRKMFCKEGSESFVTLFEGNRENIMKNGTYNRYEVFDWGINSKIWSEFDNFILRQICYHWDRRGLSFWDVEGIFRIWNHPRIAISPVQMNFQNSSFVMLLGEPQLLINKCYNWQREKEK